MHDKSDRSRAFGSSPALERSISSASSTLDRSKLSTPTMSKHAEEIRVISDNFQDLLKTATKEITRYRTEKVELEKDYKKLLSANEEMADELSRLLAREKSFDKTKDAITGANEDLFREAQRLTDEEARWSKEKAEWTAEKFELSQRLSQLANKCERLEHERQEREIDSLGRRKHNEDDDEEELLADKLEVIDNLREENVKLLELYKAGMAEKEDRMRKISLLEAENESLQARKENASGENLQLMLEMDNQSKAITALREEVKISKDRIRYLEKENKELVCKSNKVKKSPDSSLLDRLAELESKNRDLLEWRNQLTDKNRSLSGENAKLKAKCTNLEDLLNEESADINDVLEIIKNMQLAASNHSCSPSSIGPISKFRDLKFPPR